MTNNKHVLSWIDEMAKMTQPDSIVWIDGSEAQLEALRAEACATGEMEKLNQDLLPGCYLHRTAVNDVARVEDRTFICTTKKEDAGNINHWMAPAECYEKLSKLFAGSMKGRTMYVIPYSMGVVGSEFAKIGLELTDSIYVVLNMAIMTRVGKEVIDALGDSADFVKGLHSKAQIDENNRYICHFPEDNTIWSVNSGYGGNVLLGKKCFALRIASYLGKKEGWMAEHMLILGIEDPEGKIQYISAAFPSACGKTNLAMLIPPELYKKKGYKVWCVGTILPGYASVRMGDFGQSIRRTVSSAWRPEPMSIPIPTRWQRHERIRFSRTLYTISTTTPCGGRGWTTIRRKMRSIGREILGMLPSSTRKTRAPTVHIPIPALRQWQPTAPAFHRSSAIRRVCRFPQSSSVADERKPLRWFMNPSAGSTEPLWAPLWHLRRQRRRPGAVGVVRRDPMAMRPFVGYNMGDYFAHWLEMGKKIPNPPKIFHVNWFRTDDDGRFIWPGFGDNMRVLMWILNRCNGKVDAVETPIGYVPKAEDLELEGLDITLDTVRELLSIDKEAWKEDAADIREFYALVGDRMPDTLYKELEALEKRLSQ